MPRLLAPVALCAVLLPQTTSQGTTTTSTTTTTPDLEAIKITTGCEAQCTYLAVQIDAECENTDFLSCCGDEPDEFFFINPSTQARSCLCSYSAETCDRQQEETMQYFSCNSATVTMLSLADSPCTKPLEEGPFPAVATFVEPGIVCVCVCVGRLDEYSPLVFACAEWPSSCSFNCSAAAVIILHAWLNRF